VHATLRIPKAEETRARGEPLLRLRDCEWDGDFGGGGGSIASPRPCRFDSQLGWSDMGVRLKEGLRWAIAGHGAVHERVDVVPGVAEVPLTFAF